MYQEDNDDTTRVGLWITFGVVALVIISTVSAVVVRQLRGIEAVPPAAAAQTVLLVEEEVVLIEAPLVGDLVGTLYFGTAESALPPGAAAELDKVVQALAAAPGRKVVLSGFHDETGDPAKNAELAKQRALSVRAALVKAGVDRSRIMLRKPEITTGSGSDQEARRVEMRLVD
ncbi:OmpA family protein [Pseudorhodoferax sp.]|uniref:OmpA family protein n=1 Tax=Pseudorhodoferax sp. TaxID=1993553 RepID=UPI0039E286FB